MQAGLRRGAMAPPVAGSPEAGITKEDALDQQEQLTILAAAAVEHEPNQGDGMQRRNCKLFVLVELILVWDARLPAKLLQLFFARAVIRLGQHTALWAALRLLRMTDTGGMNPNITRNFERNSKAMAGCAILRVTPD